jgi:hypothetical protein
MKSFKSYITEGRPSQRHPLEGHEYHRKTDAELVYIAKDAHKAAEAMKGHNTQAENKYRDQANDSATVRYFRQKNGMPNWYKKKYGHIKEEDSYVAKFAKERFPNAKVSTPESRAKDAEEVKKRHEAAAKKPIAPRPPSPSAYPLGGYDPKSNRSYSEEVELDEMDKSQPSSSRGAEGLPVGKKAKPEKTDKVTKDALKVLQKQYKKVKEEVELDEVAAWQRKEGKNPEGGLNQKGVESYRRENPGSKLQTAVTTKPSKLDPDSKSAKRRKSFCARMGGMKKRLTSAKTANDPDSRINKALRKWNC